MSSVFFGPAIWLMSRLRFGMKFALSGTIVFGLLAFLGVASVIASYQQVGALRSQAAAVDLMKSLAQWNQVLIESRRITITAPPGDTTVRERFRQQAAVVERTLTEIETQVAQALPLFDMRKDVQGLREGWVELQKKVEALPLDAEFAPKAFAAHAPEYGRLYAFMREMGDRSGMALGSDLDLFYLGYPLANNTPSTAGIAVRMAAYTALNMARGVLSPADKVFYEVTEARLNDTFGNVQNMLKQAMKANPDLEQRLGPPFDALKTSSQQYLAFVRKHFTAADAITVTPAQAAEAARPTIDAAWALVEQNRAVLADLLAERIERATLHRNLTTALLLLGTLASLYFYVGMYLGTRHSLDRVTGSVRAIADGQLGQVQPVQARDEFADLSSALAQADQALAAMIAKVRLSSESVASASADIAQGNQHLSERTEEQASALQQTAATMEQLNTTVRANADSAVQANDLAQTASQVAAQGGEVVGRVVGTMQAISDSSSQISDIIGVIDGIAFQTNILALNAAVEAARAGEQGRGFAVVAGEVRTLAQRSAEAAKQIKTLIGRSVEQVQGGTQLVAEAGQTMAEIVASIQRVSHIVAEISSASQAQSAGITQVGQAVGQMDHVTQQNAALVEQSAAAAESLKSQAQQLVRAVDVFKLAGAQAGA
ncbi:methyl-accepting chemotaxis protein [Aquincola tertiaricarbonis]|uniref:methyl-accepting chemotaxis protein n=1 Tax=Aquincola tertiaricarbonis TaxID=391953 RepID=UPI0028738805|nr:methyl-accepting chemotaxis protein [Aquincola tertiaricarbonis]